MISAALSPHTLKAAILARHGSVHAFCRRHAAGGEGQLKRSTVYMALSGRYPGKVAPQLAKIHAVLEDTPPPEARAALPAPESMARALQDIRCKHCRTIDKRRCMDCRTQTAREAKELHTVIFDVQ